MTTKTFDGQTARFLASVATCIPPLSSDVMQGWIDNPQGLKKVLGCLNPPATDSQNHLTVNYDQSLEQMIADGNYDWKNSDITSKRFSINGQGTVQFERRYFHFDRDISSDDAKGLIEADGWEVAKIEHLLANGKQFPEDQRKFPIIALGSVAGVSGHRNVPCLLGGGSRRNLLLDWWDDEWNRHCHFLAVRKISAS